MNDNIKKLATRETAFAAEHHDMVYLFLEENKLSEEDYYDVIVFGYLEAVKKYLRRPQLQEYSFESVAKKAMNACLGNYRRSLSNVESSISVCSLHTGLDDDYSIENTVQYAKNSIEAAISSLDWQQTVSALDETERRIIDMLASGYLKGEIPKLLGITPTVFNKKIDSIRRTFLSSPIMAA